jgi:hypothetical protein
MDPAYSLFFGTSATTDGIYYGWSENPVLTFLLFLDDDLNPPAYCEGGCFAYWDPTYGYTLPYTGWYTLGVYDFIACYGTTSALDYHLTIDGLTIVIDGCNTYVNNQMIGETNMQLLIDQCAIGAKNHGKYVSCVAQLTGGWVEMGLMLLFPAQPNLIFHIQNNVYKRLNE